MIPIILKKWILLVVVFVAASGLLYTFATYEGAADENEYVDEEVLEDAFEVNGPLTLKVVLERIYLDGEVSEEILDETVWAMEDFWAQYEDWQVIDLDGEQVVFQQYIDDISPLLKSNGYFGISDDGILTIYEGKPTEASKIIQSFFQIDVGKLESHQHEQLKGGIKVGTKDDYVQVLETFKPYTTKKQ
ncbi:intercompartmental signaling factor BofC [Bacillus sp. RO1]|uniref:intercompartmental signaling factor BofC n=1 Tax=Bacillus sp. RO1 TaxID=2722703 RepID=UPI00145635E3|nr:intercompartmental signaling factor BofC [Bacillus sp. RO1]NLP49469.1 regulator [Bacillus sp. RO1]